MIFSSNLDGHYGQYDSYALCKSCVVFGKNFLILGHFFYFLFKKLLYAVMKQNLFSI